MYEFSWASFLIGLLVIIAATVILRYHQVIADNLGSGISDYDRFKFWSLIAIGVGFLIATNIHAVLLTAIIRTIFPSF